MRSKSISWNAFSEVICLHRLTPSLDLEASQGLGFVLFGRLSLIQSIVSGTCPVNVWGVVSDREVEEPLIFLEPQFVLLLNRDKNVSKDSNNT